MNYQLKFLESYLIYHFEYWCLGFHFLIQSQIDQSSHLLDQLDFWMLLRINYKIYHLLKSKLHCNKKFFQFYLLLFFFSLFIENSDISYHYGKCYFISNNFQYFYFFSVVWNYFFFPLVLLCSSLVKSRFSASIF